jgi:predicted DNA-binding transcriptional regulator AlpA
MTDLTTSRLPTEENLIKGVEIDADLGIKDRTRRNMIADGRLPPPAGYIGGRAVWRRADYLAARERLLTLSAPRRPGATAQAA